ncbi:MAG: aminotransferase, partial [Bacteroidales bacterium]|nr:aminotransferase [Bacteroidales bacterium]
MDYKDFFSDDVPSFMRSPVREIFRKVDLASIYSFAGGYPDASTFPLGEMEALTRTVVEKYGARALQYGGTQGVPELREALSRWYAPWLYGTSGKAAIPLENIQITTSSQ